MVDTLGNVMWGTHYSAGAMFNGVRVVLCLFDLSVSRSWKDLKASDRYDNLRTEFTRRDSKFTQVNVIVVGAKSDKQHVVKDADVMEFIFELASQDQGEQKNCFVIDDNYFKCSAKTGQGMKEIMEYVASLIANHTHERTNRGTVPLIADSNTTKSQNSCCL